MMNLQNGRCVENDIKYVDLDQKEFDAYRLIHGDVLFNRTNSYELVGRTGMYDLQGDHVFASYLVRIKVDEAKLSPRYLTLFLNSYGCGSFEPRFLGDHAAHLTSSFWGADA